MRAVTLIGLAALSASTAVAQEAPPAVQPALKISGSATLVSRYRFRGIGLSDEHPALQAAINLNHESGLYAGVWSSSLDGFGELGGSNIEVDLTGGFKKDLGHGLTNRRDVRDSPTGITSLVRPARRARAPGLHHHPAGIDHDALQRVRCAENAQATSRPSLLPKCHESVRRPSRRPDRPSAP